LRIRRPRNAARKLVEVAAGIEAVQDGRIHIEKINGRFIYQLRDTPGEGAGCVYVKITEAGAAPELDDPERSSNKAAPKTDWNSNA